MTFIEPIRLWLLVAVAALLIAYVIMSTRRRTFAVRFTNLAMLDKVAPERPGWRRHVPAALFLVALVSLVVSFARPTRSTEVARERATVILAIDTSLSMEATDVIPSRIDGAKEAAVSFLESVPEQINIGLVSFNGIATVRVPPTTDRESVQRAIENLQLGEATAIGEAILASLDAVAAVLPDPDGAIAPARIVLMSDGETTVGRPNEDAVAAAVEANVPVSTITFGTAEGVIRLDELGLIPVPVNREELRAIAEATGGQFFAAETTTELADVYADIGSSIGFITERTEIVTWFVAASMALMALAGAFSLMWFSRLP